VNAELVHNLDWLEKQPYEKGWICSIKPDQLAAELENLKIGEKALAWYQQKIKRFRDLLATESGNGRPAGFPEIGQLVEGWLEEMDEPMWSKLGESFLSAKCAAV